MNELDRDFWITVRAALIMFIRAIEKRYDLKKYDTMQITTAAER